MRILQPDKEGVKINFTKNVAAAGTRGGESTFGDVVAQFPLTHPQVGRRFRNVESAHAAHPLSQYPTPLNPMAFASAPAAGVRGSAPMAAPRTLCPLPYLVLAFIVSISISVRRCCVVSIKSVSVNGRLTCRSSISTTRATEDTPPFCAVGLLLACAARVVAFWSVPVGTGGQKDD